MNLDSLRNSLCLVTGATGFTGSVLVKQLHEAGARIRAIARATSRREHLAHLPIEWIEGDVYSPEAIAKATKDVEYVFHVAAAYREAGIADEIYTKVHVTSTELLVSALAQEKNLKRLVHVSTVGVHGHIEHPPGNENTPYHPGDQYQRTKLEGELLLRKKGTALKIPWTVIRPAAIYGPGDKRLLKMFKLASKPVLPVIGYGKCLYHLIHVEDLSRAIIQSAVTQGAVHEAFIIGNIEPYPLIEMASTISQELGKKLRVLRIPAWPIFMLADLCEVVCKPFGIEPPLYRRRVAFFTKDRAFDTSKMQQILGFISTLTNKDGVIETTRWYRDNRWL